VTLRTLQKWHGAGNDFLVEVTEQGTAPSWTPERVREVCDRHVGVGADGLAIAMIGSDVAMVLYNADGSVAEMSGNGIRCLAAAVRRATHATWDSLDVHTDTGVRTVSLEMNEDAGYGSVAMGPVTFGRPLDGALATAYVGNPHVVVLDDPAWSDVHRVRLAQWWSEEMGGANVEFVSLVGDGHLSLRVIERGVGWTLACGTGSCASAAVFHRDGLVGPDVLVDNPGGQLQVHLERGHATLSGPVQFVANVEWLEA
jgi:diaminopimelate epimerase